MAVISSGGLPSWVTNAGGNLLIQLNAATPSSLRSAVAASLKPRLTVNHLDGGGIPAGPVLLEQAQVVSLDPANPNLVGCKVNNPANWISWTTVGNEVFCGGPLVDPVGAAILASGPDTRGPSRASGLADPAVTWQDTVSISTITTAAETALDADGLTRLVDRCITGATTDTYIKVGAAAATINPVQASDTTINGPELLYAARILVTD